MKRHPSFLLLVTLTVKFYGMSGRVTVRVM